ncbi:LRR receptor-like serine/threonine-protein kinase GSO1 [Lotus japonicus]|uniref:LRR receptor-like serine/threonine-protein kinase GSO1 n=1 Tax=Lotus japonicus TaxID=34305 RepID=UPI00258CE1A7|nr:LRR receptor-like serine/threonine-protein kinase GSO1 [Lotus japonicus]
MGFLSFPKLHLLLIFTASITSFNAESKTHWEDTEVLKQLKNSIDPSSLNPGSCLSSWDFTLDPCDNLFSEKFTCGFRCDAVESGTSRLTELSLDQAGYSGSLAATTWNNLPYLDTVDISNNNFSGQIPESLSNLTRLRRLGLSRNSFTGEIPSSIGSLSNLEELYLDGNNLQGTIPGSFNGLKSLNRLELQFNKLSGELPNLGSLKNLNYMDLSVNAITGALPATLPESLVQISMRNNSLKGELASESFRNLRYLQVVDLSYNEFRGSVPFALFQLPSLQQLSLSHNQFSFLQEPSSALDSLSSGLVEIDLSNNELEGFLPLFMAVMPKLASLSLENNRFSGMIPTQYALKAVFPESGVSQFERLLLGGNFLFGGIPSALMALEPGSANVGLAGNCLYRCPRVLFFCQGEDQKSFDECKRFIP